MQGDLALGIVCHYKITLLKTSLKRMAHFLTLLSTSRFEWARSPERESALSQEKAPHFSLKGPGTQDELDRRAFTGIAG